MRRRRRSPALGAVLALLIAPGLAAGGEPPATPPVPGDVPTGVIAGRVTDAATGRPIPGVEVRIWQVDSFVTSRSTGRTAAVRGWPRVPASSRLNIESSICTSHAD